MLLSKTRGERYEVLGEHDRIEVISGALQWIFVLLDQCRQLLEIGPKLCCGPKQANADLGHLREIEIVGGCRKRIYMRLNPLVSVSHIGLIRNRQKIVNPTS